MIASRHDLGSHTGTAQYVDVAAPRTCEADDVRSSKGAQQRQPPPRLPGESACGDGWHSAICCPWCSPPGATRESPAPCWCGEQAGGERPWVHCWVPKVSGMHSGLLTSAEPGGDEQVTATKDDEELSASNSVPLSVHGHAAARSSSLSLLARPSVLSSTSCERASLQRAESCGCARRLCCCGCGAAASAECGASKSGRRAMSTFGVPLEDMVTHHGRRAREGCSA